MNKKTVDGFLVGQILIPRTQRLLLRNTFLPLQEGKVTGIHGRTGSGKSTLLRIIAGVRTPHTQDLEIATSWQPSSLGLNLSNSVGFIEQSPKDNIVTRYVSDELILSQESAGRGEDECVTSVNLVAKTLNMVHLLERSTTELSVGEVQKVAIAEALTRDCKLLLLDEPTAHLDEESKDGLIRILKDSVGRRPRVRIVIASHDGELLSAACDQVYEIRDQSLVTVGLPRLRDRVLRNTVNKLVKGKSEPVLNVQNLSYSYGSRKVLDSISFEVARGERLLIRGPNGAGKSTLLRLIAGLVKKGYTGRIEVEGKDIKDLDDIWPRIIYLSMQEPNEQLLSSTVKEELALNFFFWGRKFTPSSLEGTILKEVFNQWNISLDDPTYTLSYGQKKILSLVPIIENPSILLLDEPFVGLDWELKQLFMDTLDSLAREGMTLCVTSHEVKSWEKRITQTVSLESAK